MKKLIRKYEEEEDALAGANYYRVVTGIDN